MNARPHWQEFIRDYGRIAILNMSIHHLDVFRFLFGDPHAVMCSIRNDPSWDFAHDDGMAFYVLEYEDGLRCVGSDDCFSWVDGQIGWRVEGTDGTAKGTIGWPDYPAGSPSTIDYVRRADGEWQAPRWNGAVVPRRVRGDDGPAHARRRDGHRARDLGRDNVRTMALVEADLSRGARAPDGRGRRGARRGGHRLTTPLTTDAVHGWVTTIPFVGDGGADVLAEAIEACEIIECDLAARAAKRRSAGDLAALYEALDALLATVSDPRASVACDLVLRSGSPRLRAAGTSCAVLGVLHEALLEVAGRRRRTGSARGGARSSRRRCASGWWRWSRAATAPRHAAPSSRSSTT